MSQKNLIGAIDQSTSGTKFTIYDKNGLEIVKNVLNHSQISKNPGWLEHDPSEIINNLNKVIDQSIEDLLKQGRDPHDLKSIGITNQRETIVAFNRKTNQVYNNAIVWCDQRTKQICQEMIQKQSGDKNSFKTITGLPISTYFSAFKIKWLMQNNESIKNELENVSFGTIDSFLCNYLTGNFYTDVSNASRTFLMDLNSLQYSQKMLQEFGIREENLAEIKNSCDEFGSIKETRLKEFNIEINAILGDQHAACLGHGNLKEKQVKQTYGTGCFMMMNIGTELRITQDGLLSTVLFKLGKDQPCYYALEGAIETGAQNINWLSHNLSIFQSFDQMDSMINSTQDNAGVYFVPAFGGLYSPYWNESSTGLIIGISHNTTKEHIVRSVIEGICYRTKDVIETMEKVSGLQIESLKVDGGITQNKLIMQMQSDIIQKYIDKTQITDSTSFGVALAAGIQSKIFNLDQLLSIIKSEKIYSPDTSQKQSNESNYQKWTKAIQRSLDW